MKPSSQLNLPAVAQSPPGTPLSPDQIALFLGLLQGQCFTPLEYFLQGLHLPALCLREAEPPGMGGQCSSRQA